MINVTSTGRFLARIFRNNTVVTVLLYMMIGIFLTGAIAQLSNMYTADAKQNITHPAPKWVTAYYAGWKQNDLRPQDIDYSAVTTIVNFAAVPGFKGDPAALDLELNQMTPESATALLKIAHSHKVKVLFSVGGAGTAKRFRKATNEDNIDDFTTNLVSLMTNDGKSYSGEKYDGIDLDWEPVEDSDRDSYKKLVNQLRDKLNATNPQHPPILTAAVKEQPDLFAQLQDKFDQINIMTYDLAGNWDDSQLTWHDAAVYNGAFPPQEGRLPSADSLVKAFMRPGVKASKLGIGIDFYGKKWQSYTNQLQKWSKNSQPTVKELAYADIVGKYYPQATHHWDEKAQAAYLSHDGSKADKYFISFDSEKSVSSKINYVNQQKLGGVIIWELGGGWLPPGAAVRDPLLQAVKHVSNLHK